MKFWNRLTRKFKSNIHIEQLESQALQASSIDGYSSDIYREAIDAIARNAAKMTGTHVINYSDHSEKKKACKLNDLLQIRPNPRMSASDFIYKLVSRLYQNNNSYAYIHRNDKGDPIGFYPINETSVQVLSDPSGSLFYRFYMDDGENATIRDRDVIHLRRHFSRNSMFGDDNRAINPALELANAENVGLSSAIENGAKIRGILSVDQLVGDEEEQKIKKRFVENHLSTQNNGGVIVVDKKFDYQPVNMNPVILDSAQSEAIREKIYSYLGIGKSIVESTYSEDEYSAFCESVIEPLAKQMSEEFTYKVFTDRERMFGNTIRFEVGSMAYMNNRTKVTTLAQLMPMGLLTINQALEMLGYEPVEDGDIRLQALNMVRRDLADMVQTNGAIGTSQALAEPQKAKEEKTDEGI